MSEKIILNAIERNDVGKGASRRLRRQKSIPGILYGENKTPVQLTFEFKDVIKLLDKDAFYSQITSLVVGEETHLAILKDMQRHPATEAPMHLDFMRIDSTHTITTRIPLHFINQDICVGVKAGGSVVHSKVDIEVKCLPNNLPEYIEVDMEKIAVNQHLHLEDIKLPVGVTAVTHGKNPEVVSVQLTRASKGADDDSEESEAETPTTD